jgi:hypothetical protein
VKFRGYEEVKYLMLVTMSGYYQRFIRLDTHVVDRVCAVDEEGVDLKKTE